MISLFRLIPVEKRVWPDQILQQKARGFSHLARLNGNPALHWCANWTVSKVGVGVISAFSQDGTMAFFMLKEPAMQRLRAEMCQCYNEIMVKISKKMSLSNSNCPSICVTCDHNLETQHGERCIPLKMCQYPFFFAWSYSWCIWMCQKSSDKSEIKFHRRSEPNYVW